MARKRLNKKVLIIGSIALALILIGVIGILLRLTQDPEEFIREAEAARAAKDYKTAVRNYRKAYGLAKRDKDKRIEISFKLADLHVEYDEWPKAMGTWNAIINLDSKNVRARSAVLNYLYEYADSGRPAAWRQVETNASELIDIEPSVYLYFVRGRARFEVADLGQTTDREEMLAQARQDLQKVLELEGDNVEAYDFLARSMVTEGRILASRGAFDEEEKSLQRAVEILEQGVESAPDNPKACANLLSGKLDAAKGAEQIRALEPEFVAAAERLDSSPDVFAALSMFYLRLGRESIDKAIEAMEKAKQLDKGNVSYATMAAQLHYIKGSYPSWQSADILKGIDIAEDALTLPAAQDVPGPRQAESARYRMALQNFLAHCYIELAVEASDRKAETQKQKWLTRAEQAVGQIQQALDSGEHPYSVMWDGRLAMVRGDKAAAVKKLYFSFEQLKALKASDTQRTGQRRRDTQFAQLCYALARVLQDSSQIGARMEFLRSAIETGVLQSKPEAILDYAEILLQLNPIDALRTIISFEENFFANDRSRLLRLRAHIAAGQFERAEQELAQMDPDNPETIKQQLSLVQARIQRNQLAIRAIKEAQEALATEQEKAQAGSENYELLKEEVDEYRNRQAELVDKFLLIKAEQVSLSDVQAVCEGHINKGDIQQAQNLIDKFLQYFPDSTVALIYKQQLAEPDPANITPARLDEIREQVFLGISDPVQRAIKLGVLYEKDNELDKAVEQYQKALEMAPASKVAANSLLNTALLKNDFELAQRLVDRSVGANLDGCQGQFFAGRLAMAKEQYQDALIKLDDCLKQRPVFSDAYVLRSVANSALGNEFAAIDDARKTVSFNPVNGGYVKHLASLLYQRDRRLGVDASPEQLAETKATLLMAKNLNPNDLQLLSFYAEYISDDEPMKALAYRQRLQKYAPSVENAALLGNLATKQALSETDEKRKAALLQVASSAFEQGYEMDPKSKLVLATWADFYRRTGQPEKAEQLLAQSQDKTLTWRYYFRAGQLNKAKQILDELYQVDSQNIDIIKGLLAIAEGTNDKQAIPGYIAELLSVEDTPENRLYQIQVLINAGLTDQAENKLAAFKEKYPGGDWVLLEAHLRTKKGQFDDALDLLNRALEGNPNNASAWHLKAELNYFKGNYTQAINDFQKSKAIAATAGLQVKLAKAYLRARRPDDAITELTAAMNDDQPPREARILLEGVYRQLGKKEDLAKLYEQALDNEPDDVVWHKRAANFLLRTGDVDRASKLFYQAWQNSQKTGGDDSALDRYLSALREQKKYGQLLAYAAEYVDTEFAPIAYANMASVKALTGEIAMAIEYYQKGIEKAGTNNDLMLEILRRMYATVGQEQTKRWCTDRLREQPDSLVANLVMLNIASDNQQYNKALGYIEKSIQIVGPDPNKEQFTERLIIKKANILELGYMRTSDEQYRDKAIEVYESILAKNPKKSDALNNLAYVLAAKGQELEKAAQYAQQACKSKPGSPDYLDTYAFVLYHQGQYSKALEIERSAVQLYEQGATAMAPAAAYDLLGRISEKLEQYDEAAAAYKRALEVGENQLSNKDKERITTAIERITGQGGRIDKTTQ